LGATVENARDKSRRLVAQARRETAAARAAVGQARTLVDRARNMVYAQRLKRAVEKMNAARSAASRRRAA
jgi:hypothetical protein